MAAVPHLTLEYTATLEEKATDPGLLEKIHSLLASEAGIRIENCKSRWREVENWVVGQGEADAAFVHLDLRFLEGRREETVEAVGRGALAILEDHFFPAPGKLELQLTVEVAEIRRSAYFKAPEGTLSPPPGKMA